MTVRVLVEEAGTNLIRFLGLVPIEQCLPVVRVRDREGEWVTISLVRHTPRWILYRVI